MNLDPNDRRISDEIDHHLEELEEHLTDQGLSTDEARTEAARRFGDAARIKDEAREVNPPTGLLVSALDRLRQDLVFAGRQLVSAK